MKSSGGIFDIKKKKDLLEKINNDLSDEDVWKDIEKSKKLSQEKSLLEKEINLYGDIENEFKQVTEFADLLASETDQDLYNYTIEEVKKLKKKIDSASFFKIFNNKLDNANAYLDIQSGSGGTEAQDWAEMLLRMYQRWCEKRKFNVENISLSHGEVAGIKSATIKVSGEYAYGWLRSETGIHRLVRKSPFDSGNRRHTSFASVYVNAEIDDNIDVNVNPSDLRVDVYRASGAGGQHVNKTESAVRITHIPSGLVTQCQNSRSQHKNKETALKQLKAKLYNLELNKKLEERDIEESNKAEIGWGNQIRSYVLDQSRVKDLRTNTESSDTQAVLDGNIDIFIEAFLKKGAK